MFGFRQIGQGFPHILSPLYINETCINVAFNDRWGVWYQCMTLQCMSCASSAVECHLCGSSGSLPRLDWFHIAPCILSVNTVIVS